MVEHFTPVGLFRVGYQEVRKFVLSFLTHRITFFLLIGLAVVLGLAFRVYNLIHSGFFFYDEGLYLQHNLLPLELISYHPPQGLSQWFKALSVYFKMALGSGKFLWFLLIDSRALFGGLYQWSYAKVLACGLGCAALPLTYLFAKQFYRSKNVALLAMAIMAFLPGAVFYSRIGLQEALSIVLVLGGLYLYVFPRAFAWRTALSGLCLALAYFSNYRLLMLPFLVFVVEVWASYAQFQKFDVRKFVWFCLTFAGCVILLGSAFDGASIRVVFAWIFHQQDMASSQFAWINFLSYPYYLFRLETWLFGCLFFANAWFVYKKRWNVLLPCVIVMAQMFVFSFPSEKGARYIAVVLPFAAMSVAFLLHTLSELRFQYAKGLTITLGGILFFGMGFQSVQLVQASSAHEAIMKDFTGKVFSSQEMVSGLYARRQNRVLPVPRTFSILLEQYSKGYRFLILDPQSYVSLVAEAKFTLQLRDYLVFIDKFAHPDKVYHHMN